MKTCVFPGTFNPFTIGHLDVVKRSARLFGSVIVAVTEETDKPELIDAAKRAALIDKCVKGLKNVSVRSFKGLLADFCKSAGADVIVRGLRNNNDFSFENTLSYVNKKLSDIETVYLITSQEHSHVSSSTVRDLIRLGADVTSFVPAEIKDDLLSLYKRR